jgi:hypothetical protein
MVWDWLYTQQGQMVSIETALCSHCSGRSFWQITKKINGASTEGLMILPKMVTAPLAHKDAPEDILSDYEEARSIAANSPRAASALLRLCIQRLCKHLGQPGKNINDDIGALVKAGLPVGIQRALDIVRVIGNNAVHPGELNAADIAGVCHSLFDLVNIIIEDRIAKPKELEKLFASLPQGALDGIAKRDGAP